MSENKKPDRLPRKPRSGGIWTIVAILLVGGIIALKFAETPSNNEAENGTGSDSADVPKHLVIISIDTLRADYLGCYGNNNVSTPNIDSLAKDGVLFEQHYSNYPLTLPAHMTQLTGVSSLGHRVRDNLYHRLPKGISTLPEVLKKEGFQTSAFVSAHTMKAGSGIERGFDTYNDDGVREVQSGELTVSERKAEDTIKLAGDWLASTGGDRAFCFIHLFDPHAPYQPQKVAGTVAADQDLVRYAGEITYVDQQIGMLLERLRKIEMLKNTLVVITSDHGEGLGEHNELTHGYYCYDTTTHVPLIISGGGDISAGTRVPSIVRNYDLAPTVIELLGIGTDVIKKQAHGISLLPLINQPDKDLGLSAYIESHYANLNANWAKIRGLRTKEGLALFSGNDRQFLTGEKQLDNNYSSAQVGIARAEIKRLLSSWLPPEKSNSSMRESVAGSPYPGESPVAQNFEPESINDTEDLDSPHSKVDVLKKYQEAELLYDERNFSGCAAKLVLLLDTDQKFLMGLKLLAAVNESLALNPKLTEAEATGLIIDAISRLEVAKQILESNKQEAASQAVKVKLSMLYVWTNQTDKLSKLAVGSEPRVVWMSIIGDYRAGTKNAEAAQKFLSEGKLSGTMLKTAQADLQRMKNGQPLEIAPWEGK